ncbi:membrane protein [Mesobacillus campisalis]|uniref:Membrane protein n=1 Tax=Mesobacillus campisalis TaxID=1408103 RepID=A0A0M2SRK1_9BACI|nr:QueT transporter family protein [Mesobacillus campisalis]KKK36783.1 membrane protein [Mesobacillus campisalis]
MNIRTIVGNGIVAALYIAVSAVIQPFGFTNVQFRVSEMFNHLIVFNKNYFYGIVLGVFLTNLFFSPIVAYDLVFGVAHSVISLLITIAAARYIQNTLGLLAINTAVFTFNMFIIAFELKLAFNLPFFFTWLTTAAGEFIVLAAGIPIVYAIHKRINLNKVL